MDNFGSLMIALILILTLATASQKGCLAGKPVAYYWSLDGQKHVLVLGDK